MSGIADYFKKLWKSLTAGVGGDEYESQKQELIDYINSDKTEEPNINKDGLTLDDAPEYERMRPPEMSDDELKKRGEAELAEYLNAGKNAIEAELAALDKKYQNDKTAAEKAASQKAAAAEDAYKKAAETLANDALKRGLARSSIAVSGQNGLAGARAQTLGQIGAEYSDAVAKLDGEISTLGVKREKALNDFNIAYAARLTAAINGLKDERDKKYAEALKYNNSLTEKEYEQAVDKTMKESDLFGERLAQAEKLQKLAGEKPYERIYNSYYAILSKMSAADAKRALSEQPRIRADLDDAHFYRLFNAFGR
ncbi:MAG: hypothetical protein LBP26_02600 [Clostridiales bacterium]|jgi:hypothetical protein|nr:hypothetical protein [Clostridiales bacterium]